MKQQSFEEALANLEQLVKELEQGDIALDDAVKKYNQGMQLSKHCHDLLKDAESVIVKMMKDDELVDFKE
jgi:exodeoxyribonuclease VII small subunit